MSVTVSPHFHLKMEKYVISERIRFFWNTRRWTPSRNLDVCTVNFVEFHHISPTDAQYTAWFTKMDSLPKSLWLQQYTAPQHTPDSCLRYSKSSARSTGWLAWATLETLFNSSHVLLWYTWSAGAFAFTQTGYLLKLVIPTTNALPRLEVECWNEDETHAVQQSPT